ncbi:hypothetical protein DPMN_086136 [Dreissena polymorpha]|uniref:Uncharacterized protein n=1 Tax=Dreissena polymorpha TaxID=45954 RepID=A0A9D3YDK4_DREPO|nr:hypothetical protein DPMN_086136 [Dreissena polymorpha]
MKPTHSYARVSYLAYKCQTLIGTIIYRIVCNSVQNYTAIDLVLVCSCQPLDFSAAETGWSHGQIYRFAQQLARTHIRRFMIQIISSSVYRQGKTRSGSEWHFSMAVGCTAYDIKPIVDMIITIKN